MNAILGLGITYLVCYAIVSVLFVVVGLFILGYFFNKWNGVLKVLLGVFLVIIGCIATIISIFATAIFLINFAIIAFAFILGGSGQVGQQFIQETIVDFLIDAISITTVILIIKIFFHTMMTKEERKQLYKELKENMFGPSGDDNDEHKDKYVTLKSGKRVKID